ncbi:MAG TPA: PilZ domain-containing protein [Syntrophomonadaceae bacterium]|nr:PilZ domain-containing protein [Syntrophomonadaceae bacterium]
MKSRRTFASTHRSLLNSFRISPAFFGIVPVQTGVTDWSSFARSLNNTFDPSRAYTVKNAVLLVLLIVMLAIPVLLIRWYFSKEVQEQRQDYKRFLERRNQQKSLQPTSEQQRNWFRLPIRLDFKWIPAAQASTTLERLYNHDKLCDISGGGLCFTTAAQLDPGEEIIVLLEPIGSKPFKINAQIRRIETSRVPQNPDHNYDDEDAYTPFPEPFDVAVQFIGISLGEQERLLSWIAQGQRDVIHDQKTEEPSSDDLEKTESIHISHEQQLEV